MEVLIKYNNPKTLKALKDFSKYFDFSINPSKSRRTIVKNEINGVSILQGNSRIDTSSLEEIFTKNKIDSKTIRRSSWQRKK